MFCPKCGKDLPDNSKFCKYCGTKIVKKKGNSNTASVANSGSDDSTRNIIIGGLVVLIIALVIIFAVIGSGVLNSGGSSSDDVSSVSGDSGAQSLSLSSFPVSEAPGLAQAIKDNNGAFPVSYKSLSLSKAQCLYILTKSVSYIGHGDTGATISVGSPSNAAHPSGRDYSTSIAQANYVDMSDRFSSWIDRNNQVPNYVGIYTGGVRDISPNKMLDIEIAILLQYESTGSLPSSVST